MPIYKQLTELLEIQSLIVSASTYGEVINTWVTVRKVKASIIKQKDEYKYQQGINPMMDSISFFMRYIPLNTKGNQILYENEAYKILSITDVPRNKNTIIECVRAK